MGKDEKGSYKRKRQNNKKKNKRKGTGDVLCFLLGLPEISETQLKEKAF